MGGERVGKRIDVYIYASDKIRISPAKALSYDGKLQPLLSMWRLRCIESWDLCCSNRYEIVLAYELQQRGLRVSRQVPVAIQYKEMTFDAAFRADLVLEDKVIVELKSVEQITEAHKKQVQTYLRLTGCKLGSLLNFGEALIKRGILRVVNGLKDD